MMSEKISSLPKHRPSQAWGVRPISVLLLIEAINVFLISANLLYQNPLPSGYRPFFMALSPAQYYALEVSSIFIPLGLMCMLAAIGFLFLLRSGWLFAMMAQGLILFICIRQYFTHQPAFIYPLMVYCIFMVLFINSSKIRAVFHSRGSGLIKEDIP